VVSEKEYLSAIVDYELFGEVERVYKAAGKRGELWRGGRRRVY